MTDGVGVSRMDWPSAVPYQAPPDDGKPHLWGQKGFKFHDLLDVINPLQHLPVISSIYRWITGDTIGNIPRIVGDAIYGGIPGAISGLFGVLLKEETGKDVGEHVIATLFGDSQATPAVPAQSANQPELTTEQAAALVHTSIETSALAPLPAVAALPTAASPSATGTTTTTVTSPTPAPASTTTPAASTPASAAPVLPDHPPIPLARGVGMSVAAPATPPAIAVSKDAATTAFLTQAAERQRQLLGSAAAAPQNGRVLSSQVVPLQLPPGSVSLMSRAPTSALSTVAPAAGGPNPNVPVDISQKMLDALDKYTALHKQNAGARGAQVDLSVSP